MKTTAEIADEYERNLVQLRQRRDELKAQAKAEPDADKRMCLWRRACILDGMITDSAVAMYLMRGGRHGK